MTMGSKWCVIVLLLLITLLQCDRSDGMMKKGKGNHGQGSGHGQGKKSTKNRRTDDGARSDHAKGPADQLSDQAKSNQPVKSNQIDEGTSSNAELEGDIPMRMRRRDMEACATTFGKYFEVPNLQEQLMKAGAVENFKIEGGPCRRFGECNGTLRNFRFRGYANTGLTEKKDAVYLIVREEDFALCADLEVAVTIRNASDRVAQVVMSVMAGNQREGEPLRAVSSICLKPLYGISMIVENLYEKAGTPRIQLEPLSMNNSLLGINEPTTTLERVLKPLVGNISKKRMIFRFWIALRRAFREAVLTVDQMVGRTEVSAAEEVVTVIVRADMGFR